MKSKHIFLVITLIIISSCTNYEERHYEWIKENKGKIFTKDMKNELSDVLGKPVNDSGEPLDNYVKFDLYYPCLWILGLWILRLVDSQACGYLACGVSGLWFFTLVDLIVWRGTTGSALWAWIYKANPY